MKTSRNPGIVVKWLGLLGAVCCLTLATARADDQSLSAQSLIDRAKIEDLITHYYYNFGREHPENFADFYAEDAELILGERSLYVIQNQGDPLQVTTQGREYATFVRTDAGWRYKTRHIMGGNEPPEGWKE